jgi:hypothetical protein
MHIYIFIVTNIILKVSSLHIKYWFIYLCLTGIYTSPGSLTSAKNKLTPVQIREHVAISILNYNSYFFYT